MKEVLLLKCGEIVLKGLNRKTFEDRLLKNLKRRMAHVADCEITMRQSVVYVEIPDDADADAVMECASRVFGFATISRAAVCPEKTLESVIATAKDYLAPNFAAAKTFKVESKRGDKKFPMTSTEISQHVGGELADLFPDVRPDMHHPDLTVHVEMREKYAFVHAGPVPGAGGMPIGSNGRAALLLSGGIDSPVAGWMMAKRGLELCGIHFFSYPYTSERAKEKVLELGRKLTAWCGRMSVHIVPLTEIQEQIRNIYHSHNGVDGYRSMTAYLKRAGHSYSATTIHKYMNTQMGLRSIVRPKKPGVKPGKPHKVFENKLKQDFHADKPNQKWCTDFTYLFLRNGDVRYNCTIIDLYDRSVVASITDCHITSELAIRTLQKALESQRLAKDSLVLHSDQGSQYTSKAFIEFCESVHVTQSMSKAGYPYDNAPMERYFNTLKNECTNLYEFRTEKELYHTVEEFAYATYNHVRPHSYNGYRTPYQVRTAA